jgi:ferredoxin
MGNSPDLCSLSFPGSNYPPLGVVAGSQLSVVLDATNSPALFGCRTGLCGTCVMVVVGELPGPDEDEREVLEIYAEEVPNARLACQIRVQGDLSLTPLALAALDGPL